jgi:hypothetical protein
MNHQQKYAILCMALIAVAGCAQANVYYPPNSATSTQTPTDHIKAQTFWKNVERLQQQLTDLSQSVDRAEARLVAETAIRESAVLAEEYQLVRPAVAHNLLVALGIKDRGLCYQWTEDLMNRLRALGLKSFQLHWGVAYRGSELREHNCVVITAKGQPFSDGIVLDPWRHSGNLFWAQVSKDSYPWKILPPSDW